MTRRPASGGSAASVAGRTRAPGQWPVTPVPDPDEFGTAYTALWRERARRVLVMQSIRASLEEQPSVRAVLACARRWVADIFRTADEVAKSKREPRK